MVTYLEADAEVCGIFGLAAAFLLVDKTMAPGNSVDRVTVKRKETVSKS